MGKCLSKNKDIKKEESKSQNPQQAQFQQQLVQQRPSTAPIQIQEMRFGATTFSRTQIGNIKNFYRIGNLLGEGAYGSVRKAVHIQNKQVRAIKTIKKNKNMTPKQVQEMQAEFQILKNMDHPNIVKVFELYDEPYQFHIVTEFCNGGDLFDKIKSSGQFTETLAAKYMYQLFLALSYLHNKSITHRDLKPENLLVSNDSGEPIIKVADFGTAKLVNPECLLNQIQGTPYYIAPEVLRKQYNWKCDIWSAGVIMYILLSGDPPFNGRNDEDIQNNVKIGNFSFPPKK